MSGNSENTGINSHENPTIPPATPNNTGTDNISSPNNTMRIICLGKTGTGKSSLANTLLGTNQFKFGRSLAGVTVTCCKGKRTFQGIELIVVDTPGLFSSERSQDEIVTAIAACTQAVLPGPHAFLLVLRCDERFSVQDQETINQLTNIFGKDQYGKNSLDYSIIVFTHIDQLDDGQNLNDLVTQSRNDPMSRILSACGNRFYGVNNRERQEATRSQYVNELVQIIRRLIETNNGREYAPPLMRDIAQLVQKRFKESHGQFKYIEPDGLVIPFPESVQAVKEFYRLQQLQQNQLEQRQNQQERHQNQQQRQEEQQGNP